MSNENLNAAPAAPAAPKNKVVAGLLAILLGWVGAHKFYLGYTKEAIIMLVVGLLCVGFGTSIMSIIGIVEGIMYLTKTDEDFDKTYVTGRKPWL